MKYSTIMAMPDSLEKFLKLEKKLLKPQHHGKDFQEGMKEYSKLFKLYRGVQQ